jgi:acyl-coenzyme A synthetase/AMP-(fatty) acid ligase
MSLSTLFTLERGDDLPVAATIPFGRFRTEVAGLAATLTGCESAALVCRDSYAFAVGLFALLQVGAEVVLPPNGQPGTLAGLAGSFERLIDDGVVAGAPPLDAALAPIDPEAKIAFFTSGSTGQPQRVVRTLRMLEREVATFEAQWGAALGRVPVLATVSHQHLYGLSFKILWPLFAGRPFDPVTHEVWESLLAVLPAGAVVISSPAHLGRLAGIAPLAEAARPAAIFSAGAPLSATAAAEALAILGRLPTEIFGSTETGAVATRRQASGDEDWSFLPGHRFVSQAEGRLCLHSPYSGDAVETADRVEPRPNGFRFLGRADRVVKIEGKRVGLAEVEAALVGLPWVEAAAVVALPRLAAAVVLTAEGRAQLAALGGFRFGRLLRQELAPTLDPAACPKQWRFVEALPSAAMGKRRDGDVAALFAVSA